MNASAQELMATLKGLEIGDEGARFSFAARLARENGWTLAYSRAVVEEYRRFVVLAMVAGHPVTPSDEVDQAWHLHLTYSRSYEAMNQALPRPLHHGPTKGGRAEDQKYQNWYERTKASYRQAFGQEPPAAIWPSTEERFGRAPHFRRVNVRENWVIPKAPAKKAGAWSLAAVAALVLAGCALSATASAGPGIPSEVLLFGGLGIVALIAIIAIISKMAGRDGRSHPGSSGCTSPYYTHTDAGGSRYDNDDPKDAAHHHDHDGSHDSTPDSSSSDGSSSDGSSSGCSSSGCGGGGCSS